MVVRYSSAFLDAFRALPRGAQRDLLAVIDEVRADNLDSLGQKGEFYRFRVAAGAVALGEILAGGPLKDQFLWIGIVDPSE